MSTQSEAYAAYRASSRDAVRFTDPNWTNSAITRERARRLTAAREALRRALPAEPKAAEGDPSKRAEALAALLPRDAKSIAVTAHEWAKVSALLDAGRSLARMLQQAERTRLAAILDQLPTRLAVESPDPSGAIAEVEGMIFDRLVALGDRSATLAQAYDAVVARDAAWRAVILETIEAGAPTVSSLSALHYQSAEEYRATRDDRPDEAADTLEAIGKLDRVIQADAREAEAA